ncbi:MAG: hypothetical protein M0R76_07185 [Proteobacteria bacterium]|nr:hypothetical protein [Pseudomonadota bacterium]
MRGAQRATWLVGWALLISLSVVLGCGEKRTQQSCRMAVEIVVAKSAHTPEALRLLRIDDERLLLLWSADGMTQFAMLDNQGALKTEPALLGTTHFAASPSAHPKAFFPQEATHFDARAIAAVVLPDGDIAVGVVTQGYGVPPGALHVARINGKTLQISVLRQLVHVDAFADTLVLAPMGQALLIGWPSVQNNRANIHLHRVDAATLETIDATLVPADGNAFGPALSHDASRMLLLWTQRIDGVSRLDFSYALQAAQIRPDLTFDNFAEVAKVRVFDAAPAVIPMADGFGIAFRDDRDDDGEAEFYFARIGNSGTVLSAPKRISRADGPRGPRIDSASANGPVFSAQIRSYQRNFLLGINRFDVWGQKMGGEFQVYADKSEFLLADVDVNGDAALFVYAESSDRGGRILSAVVHCR